MKVISVIGLKGGSGKTSTAVPLALEAAQRGNTVLLDLDETPSASQWIESADLSGLTGERLVGHRINIKELNQTMRELRASGQVAYVVIDTPPVYRDVCMQSAGVADVAVIPVHIGSGDVAQVVATLDLLEMPKAARPHLRTLVVLNHAGTMPVVTRETRELLSTLEVEVARTEIPYRKTYALAKGNRPTADWWHFTNLWNEVEAML